MTTLSIGDTALKCLHSWTTGDLATTRELLQDDVTFVGPLGATIGAQGYIDGVVGMADLVERADHTKVLVDGDDVCISYDLITTGAGAIPTVGWYHFRDGKIDSVRAFFDPRPLTHREATAAPGMPLFAASLQICAEEYL